MIRHSNKADQKVLKLCGICTVIYKAAPANGIFNIKPFKYDLTRTHLAFWQLIPAVKSDSLEISTR